MQRQVHEPSKISSEKIIENAHFYAVKADHAYLAVIFTFLANLGIANKPFLESHSYIFFPIAAVLKIIDWFSYTVMLYWSPNKNAGKIANFAIKTMEAILIGTAVWGAKVIGTAMILGVSVGVGPIIFASLFAFGVLYNTARFLYFATKAYLSRNKNDAQAEAFYRGQAKQTLMNIGLAGLGFTTIALTLLFPQVMLAVAATFAITAVVAILAAVIFRGTRFGDALQSGIDFVFDKLTGTEQQPELIVNEISPEHQASCETVKILPNNINDEYYTNTLKLQKPVELTYEQLFQNIIDYKTVLQDQIKNANSTARHRFWPETIKRENKIEALEFLQAFMGKFKTIVDSQNINGPKNITLGQHEFRYENAAELVELVNDHVTNHYDEAFQSFFKDTGGVEALFKHAYKIINKAYEDKKKDVPTVFGVPFEITAIPVRTVVNLV